MQVSINGGLAITYSNSTIPIRYGFKCRFLGGHIQRSESGELSLAADEDKKARAVLTAQEVNFVGPEIQKMLRSRKVSASPSPLKFSNKYQYPFPIADEYLRNLAIENAEADNKPTIVPTGESVIIAEPEQQTNDVKMDAVDAGSGTLKPNFAVNVIVETRTGELSGPLSQVDTPDMPVRFSEKKRLQWAGKTCTLNRLAKFSSKYLCLANRPRPIDDGWKSCKFLSTCLKVS